MTTDSEHHRVAVIRVEVRDQPADGLLIELLEVGQAPGSDRLLGSATTASCLCRVIERWLQELTSTAAELGADRMTFTTCADPSGPAPCADKTVSLIQPHNQG